MENYVFYFINIISHVEKKFVVSVGRLSEQSILCDGCYSYVALIFTGIGSLGVRCKFKFWHANLYIYKKTIFIAYIGRVDKKKTI